MKTIGVIFTNLKVQDADVAVARRNYTFNVSDEVKVGDLIESPNYKQKLQVTEIKDKVYTHYDNNGKLFTLVGVETELPEIKLIKLVDQLSNEILGKVIKE